MHVFSECVPLANVYPHGIVYIQNRGSRAQHANLNSLQRATLRYAYRGDGIHKALVLMHSAGTSQGMIWQFSRVTTASHVVGALWFHCAEMYPLCPLKTERDGMAFYTTL